jgi:hypothetical protein
MPSVPRESLLNRQLLQVLESQQHQTQKRANPETTLCPTYFGEWTRKPNATETAVECDLGDIRSLLSGEKEGMDRKRDSTLAKASIQTLRATLPRANQLWLSRTESHCLTTKDNFSSWCCWPKVDRNVKVIWLKRLCRHHDERVRIRHLSPGSAESATLCLSPIELMMPRDSFVLLSAISLLDRGDNSDPGHKNIQPEAVSSTLGAANGAATLFSSRYATCCHSYGYAASPKG